MSTPHISQCPMRMFARHSDAARRVSDTWNLHRQADPYGSIRQWFAVRLVDGTTDGVLYPSKAVAIAHQHHNEAWYAFLCISPASMNYCDAEIYLATLRKFADAGFKMADPDATHGGRDVIQRSTREDMLELLQGRASNLIIPGRN